MKFEYFPSFHNSVVVRVQMLAELEEIIQFKRCHDDPEAQAFTKSTWMKRLVTEKDRKTDSYFF